MSSLRRWLRLEVLLLLIIIILLIVVAGLLCNKCCRPPHGRKPHAKDTTALGSWNILLPGPTTSDGVASIVSRLEQELTDSLALYGYTPEEIHFKPYYCPCDSLLINLSVTLIDESGGSKIPPSPPSSISPQGGSGWLASIQYNTDLYIPEIEDRPKIIPDTGDILNDYTRPQGPTPGSRAIRVAFIDTGIDSVFAKRTGIDRFLIPRSSLSFSNFLPFADPHDNRDDDAYMQHGSLVTAAFVQRWNGNIFNMKLMELKALDGHGSGSAFSASCAISYAIQQKVDLINASWGYYGAVDSILYHYIGLCNKDSIAFVAAAGNVKGAHLPSMVGWHSLGYPNDKGLLTDGSDGLPPNLFYPACFSKDMPYVITVTGLNKDVTPDPLPCYYQDYSPKFVSIGVINSRTCCTFTLGSTAVEGSSFEAPVVSYDAASALSTLHGARPAKAIDLIGSLQTNVPLAIYIQQGRYLNN